MRFKKLCRQNYRALSGIGIVSLMPLICSSLITTLLIQYETILRNFTPEQWLPFFLLSSLTMATAIIPTTFIAVAGGYFLSWAATPWVILAYLMASILGFGLGRIIDGGRLFKSMSASNRFTVFINEMNKQDWALVILVRISPVLPFSLINLLLPETRIRFKTFLLAGSIGMLPRTLFSIWLGSQARNLVQLFQQPEQSAVTGGAVYPYHHHLCSWHFLHSAESLCQIIDES